MVEIKGEAGEAFSSCGVKIEVKEDGGVFPYSIVEIKKKKGRGRLFVLKLKKGQMEEGFPLSWCQN